MMVESTGKRFALIGAAGFVAPRHMAAIMDAGGDLVAAIDPHDSVGVLDSYFPNCEFFTEFERFDRHIYKHPVDYVVVASPNYLHDAHCRWALRMGADVICEKPLVLREHNLDGLLELENETGKRVWPILQLRCHPAITGKEFDFDKISVTYHTPRGKWYHYSWKSVDEKSGGLATNIGVHLFDLGAYVLGKFLFVRCMDETNDGIIGLVEFERGPLDFSLSISPLNKPKRLFRLGSVELDLSGGFTGLHSEVYRRILDGTWYGANDARQAIRVCDKIREISQRGRERSYGVRPTCSAA